MKGIILLIVVIGINTISIDGYRFSIHKRTKATKATESPNPYPDSNTNQKPIVIVDQDAGSDDAIGLLMLIAAHKRGDIELKAITCVSGNTNVDNVTVNVLRVLQAASALNIPVYRGASESLLPLQLVQSSPEEESWHGKDGFGDVITDNPPDMSLVKSEHAVNALYRMVKEQPNKVTVIVLGPETNIALAMKMYPDFVDLVKDMFIMGGNYKGVGNLSDAAEFNFGIDPEAAAIVLEETKKKITVLPWETCRAPKITTEWRFNVMGAIDNPQMLLMNKVEKSVLDKHPSTSYSACDSSAVAAMLDPRVIEDSFEINASVELDGRLTRGQMVLDHVPTYEPNVKIITKLNEKLFKKMLLFAAGHKDSGY